MVTAIKFGDVAQALSACAGPAEAWTLMRATADALGYNSVDYGLARLRTSTPRGPDDFVVLQHLSTFDWSDQYVEREYQKHDRITRAALQRLTPYSYAELWERPFESDRQREMENDIRFHGVRSGLNVPLHGPGMTFAALSLGSHLPETERRRLEAETLPTVYLIAALFNARMHELLQAPRADGDELTKRERECLGWAARGKTAWETATILSISESGVKKHLARAARKLNALTRTQSVAEAVRRGLIEP